MYGYDDDDDDDVDEVCVCVNSNLVWQLLVSVHRFVLDCHPI